MKIEELNGLGNTLLELAESSFGKREMGNIKSLRYQFFEVTIKTQPEMCGDTMYLTALAQNNSVEAAFQIAHEVIHVLSPAPLASISTLEEGLAVYFSFFALERLFGKGTATNYIDPIKKSNDLIYKKYYRAYDLVLKIPGDLMSVISSLRSENPQTKLSDLSIDELHKYISDRDLCLELSKKFY